MMRIIRYLKRLNDVLPELVATILVYGVIIELVGVWWVKDPVRYTSGLVIGIGLALFLSINIASSIWGMMDVHSKKAQVFVTLKAVARYAVVVTVSMAMGYFNLGNILTWFVGIMGLKVAALMQPLIHKVFFEKSKQNEKGRD